MASTVSMAGGEMIKSPKSDSATALPAPRTLVNKSGELLDTICEVDSAYLEAGIHIGANLLWQLLDL